MSAATEKQQAASNNNHDDSLCTDQHYRAPVMPYINYRLLVHVKEQRCNQAQKHRRFWEANEKQRSNSDEKTAIKTEIIPKKRLTEDSCRNNTVADPSLAAIS